MEKLANEILEEIFSYLDLSSLKAAVKVSERWSLIIKSSRKIGKYLAITLNKSTVEIPIDGLQYGHLVIKIYRRLPLFPDFKSEFDYLDLILEKYRDTIRKATFDIYNMEDSVNFWLRDITHLKIIQPDFIFLFSRFNAWNMSPFEKLKHLEMDLRSIDVVYDYVTGFQWMNKAKLTHLKVYVREKMDDSVLEKFYSTVLYQQISTIQELYLRGFKQAHFSLKTIVEKSEHLKIFELAFEDFSGSPNLLTAMKSPEDYKCGWKKWNQLIFKNIESEHLNLMIEILQNHQDASTLVLEYERANDDCILSEIPNLQKIVFTFTEDMKRSFEDFSKAQSLELRRLENNAQMAKLIEFLNKCSDLKVLKLNLISSRAKFTPHTMQALLKAVKTLEELHLDAYSDRFEISSESIEIIKTDGKNLKKLTLTVDDLSAEKFRDQMKIFNDTKVRAVVMGKVIVPTSLENSSAIEAFFSKKAKTAACVWKK